MAAQKSELRQSASIDTQPIASAPVLNPLPTSAMPNGIAQTQDGWLSRNTICPPGLESLILISQLVLQESFASGAILDTWTEPNKYTVTKRNGEPMYHIIEESSLCMRLCLGAFHPCEFAVVDEFGKEVLRITRKISCGSCLCSTQNIKIYSGETLLGSVTEDFNILTPNFSIRDASGDVVLKLIGPMLYSGGKSTFKVKSVDGKHRIGSIEKREGLVNVFDIAFPIDLCVKLKSVLLGACVLMDIKYIHRLHSF